MRAASVAAVAGDQVGYLFGKQVGPPLFSRPDSRLFKQEHLEQAAGVLRAPRRPPIVLARFVPIVRTFTPIVAGASRMHYRTFVLYNVIGGVAVGRRCDGPRLLPRPDRVREDNIELILIGIVALSVVPIAIELLRSRARSRQR